MKSEVYEFQPGLFLRAPFYSYEQYDLSALPQVLQDQNFRNAIWLASPVFYWLIRKKAFDFERLTEKERHTLAKYYNRMCYRPTPFGSFASFTTLKWSDQGPVILSDNNQALLHLLPDRELSAVNFKTGRPFTPETLLIKNPTIYRLGEYFRFFSTETGPKGRFRFTIDQIEAVKFHQQLLQLLAKGPRKARDIEQWILAEAACTKDEANEYLRFLVEDQILYTTDQGQLIFDAANQRQVLLADYELASVFTESERKAYFYAALERPLIAGGLTSQVKEELQAAIRLLQRLALPAPLEALDQFIADIKARFDLQKVPLLLAIDPDAGITYGDRLAQAAEDQLLADILFPAPGKKSAIKWESTRQFFLRLWLNDHARCWDAPITITDDDILELNILPASQFPPSIAVMFRKTEDNLVLEHAGGSSATQLPGRFSLFSEATFNLCQEIVAAEQAANPDILFADIEQLSDTYLDNINQRRQIYPYTIPLNVYSKTAHEWQLPPDDLLLSVRGDILIMESASLGKRVIPRLATAYNHHHNEMPLFRLLGDLQFQGLRSSLSLELGLLFPGLSYYPRVVYRNVILSLAKWVLKSGELTVLHQRLTNQVPGELELFKRSLALPPVFSVGQHDQQLVINLRDAADRGLFLQWLKGKDELVITEYLISDQTVRANGQALAGQYIGVLTQAETVYRPLQKETRSTAKQTRNFTPGSDWLFVKLYCTPASANLILEKVVAPVVSSHQARIRSWFFIRYSDPQYHLRVRIRVKGNEAGQLLVALKMQIKKAKMEELINRFVCDTYSREIERYGAKYMVRAEAVFHAGSILVSQFLTQQKVVNAQLTELEFALKTALGMIRTFYPAALECLAFVQEITESFLTEFKADKSFKVTLDSKYRHLKGRVGQALAKDFDAEAGEEFAGLQIKLRDLSDVLPAKQTLVKRRMLGDLIHMQMNRTFRQNQRQQELFVYYCLNKYLISASAKVKPLTQAG